MDIVYKASDPLDEFYRICDEQGEEKRLEARRKLYEEKDFNCVYCLYHEKYSGCMYKECPLTPERVCCGCATIASAWRYILKRALSFYDNYECGKELYRLFRESFEMTDAVIAEQGFVELVPYFNKETYAVTIAGYMTDIGTEKTETGGYFFKFSEISRKFGLALPGDNMMPERIKNAFNKSIVKYVDTSSGFYLTFNEEYCPHISDRFEEVSDDDEGYDFK